MGEVLFFYTYNNMSTKNLHLSTTLKIVKYIFTPILFCKSINAMEKILADLQRI